MKKQFKAASFIAVLIFSATIINAQTPPPPPGMPLVAQGDKRMAPPPPAAEQSLQEVTAFNGKVVKLAANDDYVYDGFYILNGNDSLLVKFPPHLGNTITKAANVGSSITVNGVQNTSPSGQKEIRMVSITANGNTIANTPPANSIPPVESVVNGSGKVSSLQTNREGRVSGFMLDNNTILRIPPHANNQLASLVQQGASISYTGNKKAANTGEAMSANYTIIHCTTLTLNGKQYLIQ